MTSRSIGSDGQWIHRQTQTTGLLYVRFFFFFSLFPSLCAIGSGEREWIRWEWGQKNVALATKVLGICILSLLPHGHGTVVQVPSELRNLILEF